MKSRLWTLILVIFVLPLVGGLVFYWQDIYTSPTGVINTERTPLAFEPNTVKDLQCNMLLHGVEHSVQLITKDHKTYFFDDIGCAILWCRDQKVELEGLTLWIYDNVAKRYIDAFSAYYSIIEETPMHYGFGAHETKSEELIPFEEMRLRMLRGENLTHPQVRKKLLGK